MNLTVVHSSTSIFFEPPKTIDEIKAKCLLEAKLTLIADIFKIKGFAGFIPNGSDFDTLLDLDIDELHTEVIKAEDWIYEMRNKTKKK